MIDDYNREGLGIEVDFSLPAVRVIRSLERIIEWRGAPKVIRSDGGPELISIPIENPSLFYRSFFKWTGYVLANTPIC